MEVGTGCADFGGPLAPKAGLQCGGFAQIRIRSKRGISENSQWWDRLTLKAASALKDVKCVTHMNGYELLTKDRGHYSGGDSCPPARIQLTAR